MEDNEFRLLSPAFKDNGVIPRPYTCKGQDVNPPLNIIGTPQNCKSLALIMHDPDAVNGDFTHWLMWDIPSSTENIAAHSIPVGAVQGANGSGNNSYMGPCPPEGTGIHHYLFELYALDKSLGLPGGTGRSKLEDALGNHVINRATLTGLFSSS